MPDLPDPARISLAVTGLALIAWTLMRWDDTPVALLACLVLMGTGAAPPTALYDSLGDSLIWLLMGAFVLSAVFQRSGLAERLSERALAGCRNFSQLSWRLTGVIAVTAFLVPSTSARAALLLPVFVALASRMPHAHHVRALALIFPTAILLSAGASLLGAGAHLVTLDFIRRHSRMEIDFLYWAWLAAPFALTACALGTWLILRLFLSSQERHAAIAPADGAEARAPLTGVQRRVGAITLLTVAGWIVESHAGVDVTAVTLLGALAATTRSLTGVSLGQAFRQVDWKLLVFLAATMTMGESLLDTGAAQAIARALVDGTGFCGEHRWAALALTVLLSLAAHLLIQSRTARAVVLLPALVLPLAGDGSGLPLLAFVCVQATGFCQTFVVSAKPVALFVRSEPSPVQPHDLVRLSAALAPLMALLLAVFAIWVWPLQGLEGPALQR